MFLIMTEFPFVYKKFFPFGSPPNTKGCPLCVLGNVAKICSGKDWLHPFAIYKLGIIT